MQGVTSKTVFNIKLVEGWVPKLELVQVGWTTANNSQTKVISGKTVAFVQVVCCKDISQKVQAFP